MSAVLSEDAWPESLFSKVSDVPVRSAKGVTVGGAAVAVFHRPDSWFAIEGEDVALDVS